MDLEYIPAKTIVSAYADNNQWFGCNYNMNIYKGCCHGCIYCDSRSECYHIEDFDRVRAKADALNIISKQLMGKRKKGVIGTGAMSDPYNPFEGEAQLTRGALKLIDMYRYGISITTKSSLITRDIDIFSKIKCHSPVMCQITITTAGDNLCKIIEPNVSLSSQRFQAIKTLSDGGLFAGILMTPILPFINDTKENILGIVEKAHESGARFVFPGFGVTLRANQREHFFQCLERDFPMLKTRYMKQFGNEYVCNSPSGRQLYEFFAQQCDKYGILYRMADIIEAYKKGYENHSEQLALTL